MKYIVKNTEILHKCGVVIKELSEFRCDFVKYLEYFQGCVDDGIVPPEDLERNLHFLYYFDSDTCELLEMIRDYMGNIENAEDNIEYIQKVIWQAQKWLGGGISPNIKRNVQSLERYYDLVPLLCSLTSSIEKHLYEYAEIENYTTMACVYEPPEMMNADYFEDTDKSQERTYPFLHAVEDDSVSKVDFEDDLMMQELYGGPEFSDTVIFSKMQEKKSDVSGITDPDETVQICRKCGEVFAMRLSVCPYCGTFSRIES